MHSNSRAPVLSATLSLDSCWIIGRSRPLPGLLQDLDQAPALRARQRPALDDAHHVALIRLVALVVSVQRVRLAHDLFVPPVPPDALESDCDRLLALARDDNSLTDLPRSRLTGYDGLLGGSRSLSSRALGALLAPPAAALARLETPLLVPLRAPLLRRALRTRGAGRARTLGPALLTG